MRKILTALAVVPALVLGTAASAIAAPAAHHPPQARRNATPACGFNCINLFSEQTGTSLIEAVYVPGSNGQAHSAKAGTLTDLKPGNLTFTNEDFSAYRNETVGQACSDGDLSPRAYACLNFATETAPGVYSGSGPVYELNWAPDGNQSGLCPGLASAGIAGENVTLQACGVRPVTLWVGDIKHAHVIGGILYMPFVNGSDTNSSMPLVLTVNTGSKSPANRLQVVNEDLFSQFVPNQDMFSFFPGPALGAKI